VANWPIKRSNAWKTLLQARAIENQSMVIGVNRVGTDNNSNIYSGDSMVVNALGEVLYTKEKEEDIYQFTIDKSAITAIRQQLPFLQDADNFTLTND
jgi:predicted amidohydrolase